jgi:hypothetical protein
MTLAVALAVPTIGLGQVTVQKNGIDVPENNVNVLYHATFRVVAEEFGLRKAPEMQVPVTLVLGDSRGGVVGDETSQVFIIYISRWDETMFATSVSRIALQHLLSRARKAHIVRESLRRANLVVPVSIGALSPSVTRQFDSPGTDFAPASPRAAINSAARCSPLPPFLQKERIGIDPPLSAKPDLSSLPESGQSRQPQPRNKRTADSAAIPN